MKRLRWENRILFVIPLIMLSITAMSFLGHAYSADPLPRRFKVYISKEGIVSHYPTAGYKQRILPNVNLFLKNPGCYIACHSTNPDKGIYAENTDNYIVGQIRVKGIYEGSKCIPEDYANLDISLEPRFSALCSKVFRCIGNSCWATGDTGGWFGLK